MLIGGEEHWAWIEACHARLRHLSSLGPVCPKCCTRQVQLRRYVDVSPAQWKCRMCKHDFEYEPQ